MLLKGYEKVLIEKFTLSKMLTEEVVPMQI